MHDETKAGALSLLAEKQTQAMGGPGPEHTNGGSFETDASDAVLASRGLGHAITDVAKQRQAAEDSIRNAAAQYYREATEAGSRSAAQIIVLLGPYIRAFRPSDKELGQLLIDTNPRHLMYPRPVVLRESGLPDATLQGAKAPKAASAYKQLPAIWRDMTDVEYGMFDRKKWDNVDPEAIKHVAKGVLIDGKVYSSPVSALQDGCNLPKVHRAFMDVLKPRIINMDTEIEADQEVAAAGKAEGLKVVVKVFNEDMNRHQPTAVKVAEHNITTVGVILGLLKAANVNKVGFTEDQIDRITEALTKVPVLVDETN